MSEESAYLLFAGHNHYPDGGIDDLRSTGTVEELKQYFSDHADEISGGNYLDNWGQIVNSKTLKCEWRGSLNDWSNNGSAEWTEEKP